ncbi:MAG TPA: xanthine dehydrogenase family protein subunit M [Anaerolineales bacterium]
MKPAPFEYQAPGSVDEALALLQQHGSDAKLLAGGQSLIPAMNFRIVQPRVLIDLNGIDGLGYVADTGASGFRIGAMTREHELESDPGIAVRLPLLAEAMPYIAHPQIRNRGTLGGSLVNADPAAELPVMMVALNARLKVCGVSGARWVAASDFFLGIFSTDLAPDEMLVEIEVPWLPVSTGWSFVEIAPRAGDYALMGVAALLDLAENGLVSRARLVYLNAGDRPVDAVRSAASLIGQPPGEDVFAAAAETASRQEMEPYGNLHASPDYQRHLARVLTRRALARAATRAKRGNGA